ncbi:hypothetical protein DXG01_013586 [Tephrocybe rancida]|nr:hypothetical protein DXG01_013586 [Tephrocybe rancida]
MAKILIDDTRGHLALLGSWSTVMSNSSIGGSMHYAGSSGGSIHLNFSGTSISFFGPINTSDPPQLGTITVDGQVTNTTRSVSLQGATPNIVTAANARWYQSPALVDGAHSIVLENVKFVFFDYAVVDAGDKTQLVGDTVVVDDGDASLVYEGSWTPSEGEKILVNDTVVVSPFGNTTHRTRTPGSSVTLRFSGTSVSVFGESIQVPDASASAKRNTSGMMVRYTLDGVTTELAYTMPVTPAMNFPLFLNDSLGKGPHTLSIQLMDAGNSDLALDYIVYTADTASNDPGHQLSIITGTIAGGVLVILVLMMAVVYRIGAQGKVGRYKKLEADQVPARFRIDPFVLPGFVPMPIPPTIQRKPPLPIFTNQREALIPVVHVAQAPFLPFDRQVATRRGRKRDAIGLSNHDINAHLAQVGSAASRNAQQLALERPAPPPYNQGSMLKANNGEVIDERLRDFLHRLE